MYSRNRRLMSTPIGPDLSALPEEDQHRIPEFAERGIDNGVQAKLREGFLWRFG